MVELKAVLENTIDDTSSIDDDIEALTAKFINPIDRIRSNFRPAPIAVATNTDPAPGVSEVDTDARNNFEGGQINPSRALESRAHAFYRTLGFPVMDPNGNFYSAGFVPNEATTTSKRNINNKISASPLQNIINLRETQVEDRRLKFAAQDSGSTAYALALRHVKPFLSMDRGKGPLDLDEQTFEVAEREDELFDLTLAATDTDAATVDDLAELIGGDGNNEFTQFKSGQHILKPFIVDPRIQATVQPDRNLICSPFLTTTQDTKISSDKTLLRPGIEYIIRVRLQDPGLDEQFTNEAVRALQGTTVDNQATATVIRDTALALAEENNINDTNIIDALRGFTTTQTATVTTLVKTIKSVVERLDKIIEDLDVGIIKLNLQPVPGVEGPEDKTGFIRTVGGTGSPSQIDTKIAQLKLEVQL